MKQSKIQEENSRYEESKETLLQEFRKRTASQQTTKGADRTKVDYLYSFARRMTSRQFFEMDSNLMDVQDELLKLQNKREVGRFF